MSLSGEVSKKAVEAYLTTERQCVNCKQTCQQWELDLGIHLGVLGLLAKQPCPPQEELRP